MDIKSPVLNVFRFTTMVSTKQNRATFIQSAVALLRVFQFDGLNLDWMYPVGAGGKPDNKQKFTLLCKVRPFPLELKEICNRICFYRMLNLTELCFFVVVE